MSVLVIGEALVDLITTPSGEVSAVPGGGPFNLARTLGRLGTDVSFAGGVSDDVFGQRISAMLSADGVAQVLPVRTGLLTTLALAALDDSGVATYRFYVEGTAAPAVGPGDISLPEGLLALAVGTLGLVLEPAADSTVKAVAAASDSTLVFVDPNCRPSVIADEAAYRERLNRVFQRADVVKVSGDDLEYLSPGLERLEAARGLLEHGVHVVLFTDGAAGVHIVTREDDMVVAVPTVDVVDTVGAGDAFGGGFLAFWLARGLTRADLNSPENLKWAVGRAVTVAAMTCQRVGANPPYLHELPAEA
jgi:fructokinase